MFVRFCQSQRRLQLSLVETRRENGKLCRSAGYPAPRHMINMSLPTSEQFERFLEFSRRPSDLQRRDYAQLCVSVIGMSGFARVRRKLCHYVVGTTLDLHLVDE